MIKIVKFDCFEVKNQNFLEIFDFLFDEVKLYCDDDYGMIEGYVSIFNLVDNGMDLVLLGVFFKFLKVCFVNKVKFLFNYDLKVVIGCIFELYEDEIGLKFKGQFLFGILVGYDSYVLVNDGVLIDFLIGYRIICFKKKDGVWQLIEVEFWEVLFVVFLMNEIVKVIFVKFDGLFIK